MALNQCNTRFRAYQLGSAGSSFSYFDGESFILIEARYNDVNIENIKNEMEKCGVKEISTLHITSWDKDHCSLPDLNKIIEELNPKKIEFPGYQPHTESGVNCLKAIKRFRQERYKIAIKVDPEYIKSLPSKSKHGYSNIIYHPKTIKHQAEFANDNSTVKFFRTGSFNVLSLGDVEDFQIASYLRSYRAIKNEVDIMILAHHGADNGFTTSSFLKIVRPKVAIATSNYDNQYEHPKQKIRELLFHNDIDLFTTKTGDIIIESIKSHIGEYKVTNLISNSEKISKQKNFKSKKMEIYNKNDDSIRSTLRKNRKKTIVKSH